MNDEVMHIQKLLCACGFSVLTDGVYGAHTRDAVVAFQRSIGLRETGEIDVDTLNALETVQNINLVNISIPHIDKSISPNN